MNGYICFFNGKQIELHKDTKAEAHDEALRVFKPKKSQKHMVHCYLAEKDGQEVIHTPTM